MKATREEHTFEGLDFLDVYDDEGEFIKGRDLRVTYTKERCNDGIGSYEFWGSKGYDSGTDYWEIDNIEWDKSKWTDAENKVIEQYINCNLEKLTEKIIETL
jgi:hypothetical protein